LSPATAIFRLKARLRPPENLLPRIRWILLLFNLFNLAVCLPILASGHGPQALRVAVLNQLIGFPAVSAMMYLVAASLRQHAPATAREAILRHAGTKLVAATEELHMRRGERRFRTLVQNSTDVIAVIRPDAGIQYLTPSVERIFGYEAQGLIGTVVTDLLHPDAAPRVLPFLHDTELRPAGEPPSLECRLRHHDGSWRDVEIRATNLLHDQDIEGVVLNIRDVTNQRRADEARRESEDRYRAIFGSASIGISLSDVDGYVVVANDAYQKMVGYTEKELRLLRFIDITHPDDIETDLGLFAASMAGERGGYQLVKRYIRKDGQTISVRLTVTILRDADGKPTFDLAMVEDVTEFTLAEEALRASETRHRQMFQGNQAIKLLINPATGTIVDANPAACTFYGYTLEALLATSMMEINMLPPAELVQTMAQAEKEERSFFVFQHRLASGETRDVEVHSSPIDVEGATLLYSIIHDITDRRRTEAALEHQALHDALTGLPNRTLLRDRLKQAIQAGHRSREPFAVCLLDLDRFKEINDTFGHQWGDLVLQEVACRLRQVLRESDTTARLGGDEFAVLLAATDGAGACATVEKLLAVFQDPIEVEAHSFDVAPSVGIALYPEHGEDVDALIRHADVAMYVAKQDNRGYAVYSADEDQNSPLRLALAGELRQAIEQGQLVLHYQPKIHLKTGHIDGVEALVRWKHPKRGLIPPDQFIPLAEHTGLIKSLTAWVLNQALQQWREWQDHGLNLCVAVNLSARNLHDSQLAATITEMLETYDMPPDRLTLELTESAVMADAAHAIDVLSRLSETGVKIAVDDFGTGHSSLAYLKRLPLDLVKIDRSFVTDLATSDDDSFIVRSVVDLAHSLRLEVVAEGVEDKQSLRLLDMMGCDLAQGFYVSRPVAPADLTDWIAQSSFQIAT
jgi:diguanylate cyclase (GGDEF)-like protein/PAS domain S-box-containing protein